MLNPSGSKINHISSSPAEQIFRKITDLVWVSPEIDLEIKDPRQVVYLGSERLVGEEGSNIGKGRQLIKGTLASKYTIIMGLTLLGNSGIQHSSSELSHVRVEGPRVCILPLPPVIN